MTLDQHFDDVVQEQANRLTDEDRYGEAADLVRTAVRVKAGLSARSSNERVSDYVDQVRDAFDDLAGGYDLAGTLEDQTESYLDGFMGEEDDTGLYDDVDLDGYMDGFEQDEGLGDIEEYAEETIIGHFHDPIKVGPTADDVTPSVDVTDEQRYGAWREVFDAMTDA